MPTNEDPAHTPDALYHAAQRGLTAMPDSARNMMIEGTKRFMGTIVEYKDLMMMYSCAIREIETKIEILNTEFRVRYHRNPISSISTRLKSTKSIAEKLARQNLPPTACNGQVRTTLQDVCSI